MAPSAPLKAPFRVRIGLLLLSLAFFTTLSHGGHLHRHLRYRQLGSPQASAVSPADELAVEISDLRQSMSSFSSGLRGYLTNISGRLSLIEKYLGIPDVDVSPKTPSSSSQAPATAPGTLTSTTSVADLPTSTSSMARTTAVTSASTATPPAWTPIFSTTCVDPLSPTTCTFSPANILATQSPNSSLSPSSTASITQVFQTESASPSSVMPQLPSSGSGSSSSSGAFDPHSGSNLAVYYGQTPETTAEGLLSLCADPRINIVILAFVPTFFADGTQYPSVSFGPACHADPTRPAAPGLLDCDALGAQVAQCQVVHGTKVLVSLGGYAAQSSFTSDTQAAAFARTLWDLFGGGTGAPGLRPLGPDVVVDGFDIDNEDHSTVHWPAFAVALKALYAADASRQYFLSAAPQCPRPDESIPADVLKLADFVWVQFYNNPACDLDAGQAFVESAAAWSKDLAGGPRFYVGMGAWSGAGRGFVDAGSLAPIVKQAKAVAGANFGGIMLWDGSAGEGNGYVKAAKDALAS